MAHYRVFHRTDPVVNRSDRVEVERTRVATPADVLTNIVYVVLTILETILLIRFLLSLTGANRANAFANFIYNVSRPLVAPFRGLFSVHTIVGNGGARFEYEVLIAMLVYALVGAIVMMIIRSFTQPLDE